MILPIQISSPMRCGYQPAILPIDNITVYNFCSVTSILCFRLSKNLFLTENLQFLNSLLVIIVADFNPQVELCPTEDRDCFVFLHSKDTKYTVGSYIIFNHIHYANNCLNPLYCNVNIYSFCTFTPPLAILYLHITLHIC